MKNKKILFTVCAINAAVMVILTYLSLSWDLNLGEATTVIKKISYFKRVLPTSKLATKFPIIKQVLPSNLDKPKRDELLFVNISYDLKLIDKNDADGFPIGYQTITDRAKLAKFFRILNSNPDYKFIVCDIFFKDPSPDDDSLSIELSKMKNILLSYHLDKKGVPDTPIFKAPRGLADYPVLGGTFLKFHLVTNDKYKSSPLLMYESIFGKKLEKRGPFYYLNNRLCLNSIILDHRVKNADILEGQSENPYPFVYLGEFLSLPDSEIAKTAKNKIILIGDFIERDVHPTVIGKMGGTLILLNVFLSLVYGDCLINWAFFAILFISYFLISLNIFSAKKLTDLAWIKKVNDWKYGKFIINLLGYILYLSIVIAVIYIIYNVYISVMFVIIYIKVVEWLLDKFEKYKDKIPFIKKKSVENT